MGHYCPNGKLLLFFQANYRSRKKGNLWLVPASAEKPVDGRIKKTINMNCRALAIEEDTEIKAGNMTYSVLLNFRKLLRQLEEPSMEALQDEQIDKWAGLFTKKIYKADEYFSTPEAPSTSLAYARQLNTSIIKKPSAKTQSR